MATSSNPFFPQTLQTISVANAAVLTTSNVVQGGVNGTKVEFLIAVNTDTIDHAMLFSANVSGVLTPMANVNVPANSGNVSLAAVNLFNSFTFLPQDANGNKYMYLANASCSLVCSANSANATGKVVAITGQAAVY